MWQHKPPGSGDIAGSAGNGENTREYIGVVADYSTDGTIRPVSIRLADGSAFAVTRVINVTHMSATSKNGAETRYYVRVGGREHYLFFEDAELTRSPRWFVLSDN